MIPAAHSDAFRRARRRRFMMRRILFVLALSLVLALISLASLAYRASSSEQASLQPVLTVKAGTPQAPPGNPQASSVDPESSGSPSDDLGRIWDAAIAEDRWPELGVGGKTTTSGNKVALTFDDGPTRRTTPQILDLLRERELKATFFVLGRQVKENPALLRRIVEEGHTLGNHTYDHTDMSGLGAGQMRGELRRTQEAVDEALGYHYPMALMRPPYGNPYLDGSESLPVFQKVVREQKLFPVMWTVDPGDYASGGHPGDIVRSVVRADKKGKKRGDDAVVILHDNHGQTVKALPELIEYYESSGRKIVDASELLADKYAGS